MPLIPRVAACVVAIPIACVALSDSPRMLTAQALPLATGVDRALFADSGGVPSGRPA